MRRNSGWKILLIIAIVGASIWQIHPLEKKIRRGLDLQGGIHVVLEVEKPKSTDKSISDVTDRALEIIRNRVDGLGVSEPIIQKEGTNHIIVDLPGISDPQRAIEIIGKTALLEFRLVRNEATLSESALVGYELLSTWSKDERGVS
jgi:preprotein translocase subunit SecD